MRTCQAFCGGKVSQSQWCYLQFPDLNLFCDETTLDLRRSQRHMPGMTLHVYENLWLWIRSLKETWNLQIASLKIASDFWNHFHFHFHCMHHVHPTRMLRRIASVPLQALAQMKTNKKQAKAWKPSMALRFLPCCSIDPVLAGSHPSQSLLMI